MLVVCDSWFGNNGLFKPLREALRERVHVLSRLRVNAVLYASATPVPGKAGRPRKYGARLGNAADLAERMRARAKRYTLHVYGGLREVLAAEQVVMLKTLRCPVRVVWVYLFGPGRFLAKEKLCSLSGQGRSGAPCCRG